MNRSTCWLTLSLFGPFLAAPAHAQATVRVDLDSAGNQGNDWTPLCAMSPDARFVAFASLSTNLVSVDTNASMDVFVRDRASGRTERVSVDSSEVEGDADSGAFAGARALSISSDGRFVAFVSSATNLVTGDTNGNLDVFVRDRRLGTTERVNVDSTEAQADDGSLPSISADGRFVAFVSTDTDLVSGDTNGTWDVFVRDRQAGTTERVSLDSAEAGVSFGAGYDTAISADGRYVAFMSPAPDLVAGDTNGKLDVFVRDRQAGTTERISLAPGGAEADDDSGFEISMSADGRCVAFWSNATNLVAVDTNAYQDVFVRDRQLATTELVSVDSGGVQQNFDTNNVYGLSISGDGRHVAFMSLADNLVAGDTNGASDIFVRDRQLGTTERASVDSAGVEGNLDSFRPAISGDGRHVSFASDASNLVLGDSNGQRDVFARDRLGNSGSPMFESCFPGTGGVIACPCGQPANPSGGCANFGAGSTSGAVLSASGAADLSADTLVLTTSNHRSPPGGVLNVFFSFKPGTATPTAGIASGAGVRCIGTGGSLKRLYTAQVFGGSASKPGMGDLGVSAQSATFAGHAIVPGETRHYFNVYRDGQAAGPCGNPAITTNLTNMGSVLWMP